MSTENGPDTARKDETTAKNWSVSGRSLIQSTSVVSAMTPAVPNPRPDSRHGSGSILRNIHGYGRFPGRKSNSEYVATFFC